MFCVRITQEECLKLRQSKQHWQTLILLLDNMVSLLQIIIFLPANEVEIFLLKVGQAWQVGPQLNPDQLRVADAVISAATNVENGLHQDTRVLYINGPACTGKTFTYNYLIA